MPTHRSTRMHAFHCEACGRYNEKPYRNGGKSQQRFCSNKCQGALLRVGNDIEKRCARCHTVKPLDAFCCDRRRPDGRASWCRGCTAEHRKTAAHRDSQRRYNRSAKGKAKARESVATRRSDPLKYAADKAVSTAIASGRLTRQPCEVCGATKVHAHHEDYTKPLDVKWLCPKHHLARHREMNDAEANAV